MITSVIIWFLNTILLLVQLIHFCSRIVSPCLSLFEYEARTSLEVPTGVYKECHGQCKHALEW